MSIAIDHHAPAAVGTVAAVMSAVVPDGVASFFAKLIAAVLTGFLTGVAVKAGGEIWSRATSGRKPRRPRR